MIEDELREPSKLDLIERIVQKSEVHENEIDGKCIFISLEHIHYLIQTTRGNQISFKQFRDMHQNEKAKYREALKNILLLIEEEKYNDAELIAYDAIGEW